MPIFRRHQEPAEPPANPHAWRPQMPGGRGFRSIGDPIIEPGWEGVRVIVHVSPHSAIVRDEEAIDCSDEFREIADAIAGASLSDELVVDGYLTVQPTQETAGRSMGTVDVPGQRELLTQFVAGERLSARRQRRVQLDPERPIAFVAVDLLVVDGTRLFDVPLLERKRLLETALRETDVVRISPYIRPPLGTFLATWRALGFDSLAYKDANSRYVPGAQSDAWATASIPRR